MQNKNNILFFKPRFFFSTFRTNNTSIPRSLFLSSFFQLHSNNTTTTTTRNNPKISELLLGFDYFFLRIFQSPSIFFFEFLFLINNNLKTSATTQQHMQVLEFFFNFFTKYCCWVLIFFNFFTKYCWVLIFFFFFERDYSRRRSVCGSALVV